jgi:hypothetical protein
MINLPGAARARRKGERVAAAVSGLALTLLAAAAEPQSGPGAPNPMCPHLDTWNPRGIKGPNRIDSLIVRFPAGNASQRGGTCSILVDASYTRERERSYSFMAAGQFLVNERFSRSSDRDSAVSGTRAFFLFPRPRRSPSSRRPPAAPSRSAWTPCAWWRSARRDSSAA